MVNIYIHGLLGKFFKKKYAFNVKSAEEAIRALDANTSDFFSKKLNFLLLDNCHYSILVDGVVIDSENLFKRKGKIKEIHFIPSVQGAGFMDIFIFVLQLAYFAYQYIQMGKVKKTEGIHIAVGGDSKSVDSTGRSYIFSNSVNIISQGATIPIGYGKMMSNSLVLQSSMKNYLSSDTFNLQTITSPNNVLFDDFLTQ